MPVWGVPICGLLPQNFAGIPNWCWIFLVALVFHCGQSLNSAFSLSLSAYKSAINKMELRHEILCFFLSSANRTFCTSMSPNSFLADLLYLWFIDWLDWLKELGNYLKYRPDEGKAFGDYSLVFWKRIELQVYSFHGLTLKLTLVCSSLWVESWS